jgi:hypothetical protein
VRSTLGNCGFIFSDGIYDSVRFRAMMRDVRAGISTIFSTWTR